MVNVSYVRANHLSLPAMDRVHRELPYSKQIQLRQPGFSRNRLLSVAGLWLLKRQLRLLGFFRFQLSQLQFPYRKKPYCLLPVDFSIAHCDDLVLCAVSCQCRVGVDVERMFRDATSDPPAPVSISDWTRVEATLKAGGSGKLSDWREVRLQADSSFYKGRQWRIYPLCCGPEHVAHLAVEPALQREPHIEEVSSVPSP